ncbi:MAG TPA: class I SAM-dependent methyltransferase [Polyangiaceae bacterium]|nr:class I SAM-dependent methyltransferase [Polyangiaceae bacterium]
MAFERLLEPLRAARILHHGGGLLVVDKPPGIPVHGGDEALGGDLVTRLGAWLSARGESDYVGVHQRLDEGTSGVLVFTTSREKNSELARASSEHALERRYLAAVTLRSRSFAERLKHGRVRLEHRLETAAGRTRVAPSGGVSASSHVSLVERHGERALVALEPETGRTHQLRVQLAHEGAPVGGDVLYGGDPAPRLLLHACELAFGGERFRAPEPHGFSAWVRGEPPVLPEPATLAALLEDAALLRAPLAKFTDTYRLVNELGDGLPAVTVDRYGDYAVLQVASPEAEARTAELAALLVELGARGVYLKRRVRGDVRRAGPERTPPLPIAGEPAPEHLLVDEYGLRLHVALGDGLSTGLFVDQRDNRRRVRELARGKSVLNLFCYTASFSVAAALGGARRVVSVDQARRPLAIARDNFRDNGLATEAHAFLQADALDWLARAGRGKERFDLIVLDPPSFASSAGGAPFSVAKGYGLLAERALALLAPGGHLFAVTNHRGTSLGRLRRTLREAAARAGVNVARLKDLAPGLDCPAGPDGPAPSKSVLLTRA